ncbi:MAG: GTP-binding protein [Nitrospiraceae bacterium]|nr:GTP-binding protein [Nitrospiraceae bacterium]
MKRILLMGNPNVGKSAVFSRLTGLHAISSNYPGTTVEFVQGRMRIGDEEALLIDVPGAYGLEATCKAEEVALEMLVGADAVIDVADATNLERSLHLTLHLIEQDVPLVVALNIWDDAKHRGISIDVPRLEKELRVPVVPTVAVTGEGISELVARLPEAANPDTPPRSEDERWLEAGRVLNKVQTLEHRHHTLLEVLGDASVRPATGLPIAAGVLFLAFVVIRMIGENLIGFVLEPLFNTLWLPVLERMSAAMDPEGFLHTILLGSLVNGQIDFVQSFGVLSTGLFVVFGMVLPYVFAFYAILGFLEDFGYLPRLAVLLDTLMHRLGLHGWAVIPMLLGFGCNVPGIMATRVLENPRERLIAATLVSVAVPCASLQAMMWGVLGPHGARYVALVYAALFVAWVIIGRLLNHVLKGESPELILEIPPYRMPSVRTIAQKLWLRMRGFLKEAMPFVLLGVLAVNMLDYVGAFDAIAAVAAPLFDRVLGLPSEAGLAIVVGILRKDVAVGMLGALQLTPKQLVVSVTVLAMTFPCIATFVVLIKELGVPSMLKSVGIMLLSSLLMGAALNVIL